MLLVIEVPSSWHTSSGQMELPAGALWSGMVQALSVNGSRTAWTGWFRQVHFFEF
jgi:hypothetical protein